MNERIKELAERAHEWAKCASWSTNPEYGDKKIEDLYNEKFAQLIIEECRGVVDDVYQTTSLELCGPLLTADEEILNHFYGDKK